MHKGMKKPEDYANEGYSIVLSPGSQSRRPVDPQTEQSTSDRPWTDLGIDYCELDPNAKEQLAALERQAERARSGEAPPASDPRSYTPQNIERLAEKARARLKRPRAK